MLFHQALINIYNLHRKKSQSYFSELGLTKGQPRMIEAIHNMEGCAQKDLAAKCELEPATVTSVLGHMEKKGLIYRTPEVLSNGKRVSRVYLTEKGQSIQADVTQIVADMESLAFRDFTESEKTECMEYLERIYANLRS